MEQPDVTGAAAGSGATRGQLRVLRISVVSIPLLLSILTLCPTIGPGDSAEFATTGTLLGVAHPPGYPLYTLLSRLFVMIVPFGSPAARVNLVSAVFASFSLLLLFETLRRLLGALWAPWAACLTLAFTTAWWSLSTTAEVYTMNAFFVTLLIWLAIRVKEEASTANVLILAYAFGLALAHHVTILLVLPALLYATSWRMCRRPRLMASCAAAAVAALTLYAYIPLRSALDPAFDFGNPDGLSGLWNHLTAPAYRGNFLPAGPTSFARALGRFPALLFEGLPYFLVWIPVLGVAASWKPRKPFLALWSLVAAPYVLLALAYEIPDIGAYFLPIHITVAALTAAGFHWVVDRVSRRMRRGGSGGMNIALIVPIVVLAGCTLAVFIKSLPVCDRSHNRLADAYGRALLRTADTMSAGEPILFVLGDHAVFPTAYLKLVEKMAPRVSVYDQSGTVLEDIYGNRRGGALRLDRALRAAIEREIILTSPGSAFYSQRQKVADGLGVPYRPVGMLFQPRPEPVPHEDLNRLWASYEFPPMDDPALYADISSRVLGGVYFQQKALLKIELGDRLQALAALQAAESVAHDLVGIQSRQVQIYLALRDLEGAIRSAQKAVELSPGSPTGLNNLGNVYCMARRWGEAEQAFGRTIRINPDLAPTYSNLATVYYATGQVERSVANLQRALSLDPTLVNARYNLALAYLRVEGRDEAVSQVRSVLDTRPDHTLSRQLLDKLEAGAGDLAWPPMMLTFTY